MPGESDQGIKFKRVDLKQNNLILANYKNVSSAKLCTTLENKHGVKVSTVEHLLAALYIVGIDNVTVEIDNEEVPIMDGSAKDFLDILKNKEGNYSPGKVSAAIAAGTYLSGAFDQQPTDIYMPGYNMNYLDMKEQRPGYTYIDPTTGEEKAYEKVYSPEEAGKDDPRMGPYSLVKQGLRTGGLAEIKKFNEGGVQYLPSKIVKDEKDYSLYEKASGYIEDETGMGNKDKDTMLAQLADGEFVSRADAILGAGIMSGASPSDFKDMRAKGAKFFYNQQSQLKRIYELTDGAKQTKN